MRVIVRVQVNMLI